VRFKVNLPNYGVFDERRVFAPGPLASPVNFRGVRIGVPICEDIWTDWGDYENVVECLAETGAELLIVPNGSPYWRDKDNVRLNVAVARVTESELPIVYVNQVGGQDELVFDGRSFVMNRHGELVTSFEGWHETVGITTWNKTDEGWICAPGNVEDLGEQIEDVYCALMLGLRDYVGKNGFPGIVLGLGLCQLQGFFEHEAGTVSHRGALYNFLFFNDGYHVEHHLRPWAHWRELPARVAANARVSRWPRRCRRPLRPQARGRSPSRRS
jgi:hypothetical protein